MLRKLGVRRVRRDVLVEPKVALPGCTLIGPVRVGYRSYASDALLRNAMIGRYCSIGRRCSIGAALYDGQSFSTHPRAAAPDFNRDPLTKIGNDVWIGDNVLVSAGVTVGDGAVIGGGTIITDDVAPYTVVSGSPAGGVGSRFDAATVEALLELRWWRFGDAAIQRAGRGASPEQLVSVLREEPLAPFDPEFATWMEP